MSKILLGKYVNTHGLKGEIRIKSNFKYKERVFNLNNEIIIDNHTYLIKTYRIHKGYDMVTLEGINDIDSIPFNKNTYVYIEREKYLDNNDYLDSDLIGFMIYNSKIEKKVLDIVYLNDVKKIFKTNTGYIPFELIENIDFIKKRIKVKEIDGL